MRWSFVVGCAGVLLSGAASAATLHVHDSGGTLATVDSSTGAVNVIGDMGVTLTDIAFDPTGKLFGLSFGALYEVDAQTAETTLIGSHGVPGGNALVFGGDGTLYAAGFSGSGLFTLDPGSGATTSLGSTGFASGGDLAFVGDEFYLASSGGELVRLDLGDLSQSAAVGDFGVANVFGIATSAEGQLFGVGGTSIFSVDLATGAALDPVSFAGQGLGQAFGQSFFTEAGAPAPETPVDPEPEMPPIPLPASAWLLGAALLGLGGAGARRRRRG